MYSAAKTFYTKPTRVLKPITLVVLFIYWSDQWYFTCKTLLLQYSVYCVR